MPALMTYFYGERVKESPAVDAGDVPNVIVKYEGPNWPSGDLSVHTDHSTLEEQEQLLCDLIGNDTQFAIIQKDDFKLRLYDWKATEEQAAPDVFLYVQGKELCSFKK